MEATGYTVYAQTFLIVMVPHAIVTVSLATALLPLLSAYGNAGDLRALAAAWPGSCAPPWRSSCRSPRCCRSWRPTWPHLWNWGAASSTYTLYILSLSLFGAGVVFFTVHYLVLRGFYALERTRTVFFIQCAVGATNIVAAVVLVRATDAVHTAPALVGAYIASYVVGSAVSFVVLRRTLAAGGGGLEVRSWSGSWCGWRSRPASRRSLPGGLRPCCPVARPQPPAGGDAAGRGAGADVLVFLVLARLMRLTEVNEVLDTLGRRLRRRTRTP